jgi:two-component system NtrC family response regulator
MRVTAAGSGEEALTRAAQARFDVALLDLHLPGISGIDVLAALKDRQPELEAILLTAHSSIESAVQAMKQGAYDYLTKPFRLADVEAHVQKAFEKVQLARRERQWVQQVAYESPRYRGPRRQRHRQGAGGTGPARQLPARRPAAGHGQLRRAAGEPAGE